MPKQYFLERYDYPKKAAPARPCQCCFVYQTYIHRIVYAVKLWPQEPISQEVASPSGNRLYKESIGGVACVRQAKSGSLAISDAFLQCNVLLGGDVATITGTCATSVKKTCVEYKGTTPGNEPTEIGNGISDHCVYKTLSSC
ncbi:putative Pectate lyase [Seiridium unicorne]|uniref:Pectate lyase n=1 Tax=Seiridium unicorne TaxID=138068 RepID=A0ABR2UI49_9PEZI